MNQQSNTTDLVIIGGGIMGLMTAYYASSFAKNITILEKNTIGSDNQEAASFSFTRSIRTDYLEPFYARLAYEAQELWLDLQRYAEQPFFVTCGCLNIAKQSVTPDLSQTYAEQSYQNINKLYFRPERLEADDLKRRFPQFAADFGTLDTKGGFLFLPAITELLLRLLQERGVTIRENATITAIAEEADGVRIETAQATIKAKKLVVAAGKGTNDLLGTLAGNRLRFPLTYDRPQRKYYYPTPDIAEQFLPENFPVFAYTDVGIYGHPIFDKQKNAVKVAYFVPVGMQKNDQKITSVDDFVAECLPLLKDVPSEDITDADMCWYDTVADDDFILGALPGFQNIVVGTGWRGTGYKFAPLMGKVMAQLALQDGTPYDITKFSPERFTQ